MSLITSCPACSTRFKIVPDQLKISDGWVRCGTCSEVFDASKRLEDPRAETPRGMTHVPVLVETFDPLPVESIAAEPIEQAPSPDDITFDIKPQEANVSLPPSQSAAEVIQAQHDSTPLVNEADESAAETNADLRLPIEPGPLDGEISPSVSAQGSPYYSSATASDEDASPHPDEMQFVKKARRAAMWKKPWVRVVLALLVLTLSAALLLQYIVHERDRLAARNPQTRELLTGLCQWMRCEVKALRDPEAIVIESSRFQKSLSADNGAEVYQLSVQLRNRADYSVAWPDLELSLTGMGDQPMIRVVLGANKYAPADSPDIAAGREYSANIFIKLDTASAGGRVSGYRLLAFYP
jgi:predicted Zn finger-like uncharacterized protein